MVCLSTQSSFIGVATFLVMTRNWWPHKEWGKVAPYLPGSGIHVQFAFATLQTFLNRTWNTRGIL